MKPLDPGYTYNVDQVCKSAWHDLLPNFSDATFYQTWSYGERSWGDHQSSHLVLEKEGRPVAMAQLRVLKSPFIWAGAAYLNWGPLWRRRDEPEDAGHLRNILRALRGEYVDARHLVLRVLPKILDRPENGKIKTIFREEGYRRSPDHLKTFVVDLSPTLEELKQNLPRTWRQSLKSAEKQELRLWEPAQPEHFDLVAQINRQMKKRKSYFGSDSRELLAVNSDLPPHLRLRVLLCDHGEETVAALGWSNIGRTSFPLVGGTGDKALRLKASFLLWWEMIRLSKEAGFERCDTAGVNKKRNPGGYDFKKSVAGRDSEEMTYIGRFDAYRNPLSLFLFSAAMAAREGLQNTARRIKPYFRKKAPSSGSRPDRPSTI